MNSRYNIIMFIICLRKTIEVCQFCWYLVKNQSNFIIVREWKFKVHLPNITPSELHITENDSIHNDFPNKWKNYSYSFNQQEEGCWLGAYSKLNSGKGVLGKIEKPKTNKEKRTWMQSGLLTTQLNVYFMDMFIILCKIFVLKQRNKAKWAKTRQL